MLTQSSKSKQQLYSLQDLKVCTAAYKNKSQDEKMLVFVTNPAKGLEKLSLYESHQTLY
jgi:hypothetical protein